MPRRECGGVAGLLRLVATACMLSLACSMKGKHKRALARKTALRLANHSADSNRGDGINPRIQDIFEVVYENMAWGHFGGGSGKGSTMEATGAARKKLKEICLGRGVASILDAPCGAMHWMPAMLSELDAEGHSYTYVGVDIVRPLIASHQRNFSAHGNWEFRVGDITVPGSVPGRYDLIMCRDAFIHLTPLRIQCAVNNFIRSGSRYLFATSTVGKKVVHFPVVKGPGSRAHRKASPVDLEREPYNFPPPVDKVVERAQPGRVQFMGLWELQEVKPFNLTDEDCGLLHAS